MRFSAASVALLAGTALAVPSNYQAPAGSYNAPSGAEGGEDTQPSTVYSTKDVVITSCGPEVTNCPGKTGAQSTPTSVPTAPASSAPVVTSSATPSSPSPIPTETSAVTKSTTVCPESSATPSVPGGPVGPVTSVSPSASVTPSASVPNGGIPGGYGSPSPSAPAYTPSYSVITTTLCEPKIVSSTVLLNPTGSASASRSAGQPSGVANPTGGSYATPSNPVGPSASPSAPFNSGAGSIGGSFVLAGVAAMAAFFLA